MRLPATVSLITLAALAACQQAPTEPTAPVEPAATTAATAATPAPDGAHNSRNSVDWAGRYIGTLPCASCPGIDTVLTLADNGTYTLEETYREQAEGKMAPVTGKFTWSADGSIITLDDAADGAAYKVGEGQLSRLGEGGAEVTGAMARDYVLTKQG